MCGVELSSEQGSHRIMNFKMNFKKFLTEDSSSKSCNFTVHVAHLQTQLCLPLHGPYISELVMK